MKTANEKWKIGVLAIAFGLTLPSAAHAAVELFFEGPPLVRPGHPVPVLLKARLGEPINALRTVVFFDPAVLEITNADDYGSVVRYWLTRPLPAAYGRLELEGIIPGGVGPGFTDTVVIARLDVVPKRVGIATLSLGETTVYRNEPVPTEADVITRPLTFIARADAPAVTLLAEPRILPGESAVRVTRDPLLNNGDWTLIFDARTPQGSLPSVQVRERRFGFGGSWHSAVSGAPLSDQTLTSILEVSIPGGDGSATVLRIIPFRLKALWAVVLVVSAGIALAIIRRRSMH